MPSDRQDPQKESSRTSSQSESIPVTDIRQRTDISIFLDPALRTNPFGHNISAEHIYRRAERIAAAVHLLTGHMPNAEPVRDLARKESIALLNHALGLRSELRAAGSESFKQTQASIRKLISLIRLLGISGYTSAQNTETLVDALDELGALLTSSQRSQLAEDTFLTRDELTPRRSEPARDSQTISSRSSQRREVRMKVSGVSIKDRLIRDTGVDGRSAGARAERIVDILRSGGILGIKDIASNLPEYSEKMIQRELAALVERNTVKKLGAKRWSKYTLL
ncbi:MAG: hypothetical protein G01um10148_182 [Parcubacteria group bacterium Gr01-1014_8]|nr:MAG: hypothetical protein G01um10148_182 [Parcubacteria group bacterium Gr01-1014_8]